MPRDRKVPQGKAPPRNRLRKKKRIESPPEENFLQEISDEPLLVIATGNWIFFPCSTITILIHGGSDSVSVNLLRRNPYCILAPKLRSGNLSGIGVLCRARVLSSTKTETSLEVTGIFRVSWDPVNDLPNVLMARWQRINEVPVSLKDFNGPAAGYAINVIGGLLDMIFEKLIELRGKEAVAVLSEPLAVEVLTRARYIGYQNLSSVIDGLLNLFLRFISLESSAWKNQFYPLFLGALVEKLVLMRLAHLTRIVGILGDVLSNKISGLDVSKEGVEDSSSLPDRYKREKESLPEVVRTEIERWLPYSGQQSESGRIYMKYIEWLLDLPWNKKTEDRTDFNEVRSLLEKSHLGLEEVKKRILEFLAVRRVKPDAKAPILCFVGPPGVGKTSLGVAIAESLGRKFVRRSLGGVKDESQIRGHRRTYTDALPGIIIDGLREAGTNNPVFMLDEIDKLGEHGRDVPSHALLEVLDPEQNNSFRDHYINFPFNLSQVLFLTTANVKENIDPTLLNRAEVIELPGYTEDEKVAIAETHIVGKVHRDLGIEPENLSARNLPSFRIFFTTAALRLLVGEYTSDAGMRDTERTIKGVAQKVLVKICEGKTQEVFRTGDGTGIKDNGDKESAEENLQIVRITTKDVPKYLGEPENKEWMPDLGKLPYGVAAILMVTTSGLGKIGFVEVSSRKDTRFDRKNTGHLSEVLKESVEVAVSRLFREGGIIENASHKIFAHTHFPEGAIPKDGPSAGLQIFVAWYSMMVKKPIKPFFAATGEIVLVRNVVLPVGGIRSKLLEAERCGIKEVAIPLANRRDLDKLPIKMLKKTMIVVSGETSRPLREISLEPKPDDLFVIYCVDKPEDVLEIAIPEYFLPHEGNIKE